MAEQNIQIGSSNTIKQEIQMLEIIKNQIFHLKEKRNSAQDAASLQELEKEIPNL